MLKVGDSVRALGFLGSLWTTVGTVVAVRPEEFFTYEVFFPCNENGPVLVHPDELVKVEE